MVHLFWAKRVWFRFFLGKARVLQFFVGGKARVVQFCCFKHTRVSSPTRPRLPSCAAQPPWPAGFGARLEPVALPDLPVCLAGNALEPPRSREKEPWHEPQRQHQHQHGVNSCGRTVVLVVRFHGIG